MSPANCNRTKSGYCCYLYVVGFNNDNEHFIKNTLHARIEEVDVTQQLKNLNAACHLNVQYYSDGNRPCAPSHPENRKEMNLPVFEFYGLYQITHLFVCNKSSFV